MTRVLHLTLKKKWFDMIASGEKKEEYREKKTYWCRRLVDGYSESERNGKMYFSLPSKKFDIIQFKNGYSKDAPVLNVKWLGMQIKEGKPEWGAEPGKKYFVIELGEIL